MPKKSRSRRRKPQSREVSLEMLAALAMQQPLSPERLLLAQMLKDAEMRAATVEAAYKSLRDKLVGLLCKDQLEAAQIAGCPPEVYAIEWIELQKVKFFPQYDATLRPFSSC